MHIAISQLFRVALVLLSLLAWFTVSNHCALAALRTAPRAHVCCEEKSAPAPADQPAENTPCCKTLRATVNPVVTLAPPQVVPAPPLWTATALETQTQLRQSEGTFTGIDPPPFSFAELVLQHSLLTHAPPRLS